MNSLVSSAIDGLRALLLRRPRGNLGAIGPDLFFALVAIYLCAALVLAALDIESPWLFQTGGVIVVLADAVLTLAAAWLLARLARRPAVVWGVASILLVATILVAGLMHWPLPSISAALIRSDSLWLALLLETLRWLWWLLVLIALARALMPNHFWRAAMAGTLAFVISAMTWWWLPSGTMLTHAASDTSSGAASATDDATSPSDAEGSTQGLTSEQVLFEQSRLVNTALDSLRPRDPDRSNLYVVAFAGDGSEDVFRNEAEYAEKLFAQRFSAAGHIVVLENNPATVTTRPLATLTNLTATLDGIAARMNPDEDILLLFATSHGSSDHELLVDLGELPLDPIGPQELNDALNTDPVIRWKVLVISACYSGGFVDALRDDSTLVLTSARSDRTSFGCGADSDITYFGKAFLVEALNKTDSLIDAFAMAKKTIAQWEHDDKVDELSEPQMASNPRIEAKLGEWQAQLGPRPAVPFAPATVTPPARDRREDSN
ncbi:MAG: C13 family peptidase [Dokdonella sp.]